MQNNERADEIGERNALEDARVPKGGDRGPCGGTVQDEAEDDEEDHASSDPAMEFMERLAAIVPPREGERHRETHDENEPREDQVSQRDSGPVRVHEWRKNRVPVAGIVDENHGGDRDPAEDIE